ncbi:hypothetical protein [Methylobacter sp. YRD-M1]|uniref:hypothetical protein n=1 Tax=Methylobacter sp. YRD-M1 TaxID=2911520 RepID=UPI00227AE65E|nr:hypothetical protein [Methylobacter sp. YRD-M1]WAK02366.1 hypothetical protein LZ558_00870 [Methylobacter sp. YRD-M1]
MTNLRVFFFAQKLDELYFDYTLDTYKPPALNSIYLCREAIDLINDIEEDLIDENNLIHVMEELEWSLNQDIVAKALISAPIKKFIQFGENVKLSDTKVRLEVLERILNPHHYIKECQIALKENIEKKSKKRINELSRVYASTLINNGVSKQHLYEKTQEFFFNGQEISYLEQIDEYFESVSFTTHHFEIYFIVSKLITRVQDSIDAFHLKVINSLPEPAQRAADIFKLHPNQNEVWVEIENIVACDRHSARKEAESNLDMVRDLFLFFSHKNRIDWRNETVITQCCDEEPVVIRKPKNSMEKCFDLRPQDASNRLNDLIKYIGLHGNSFVKFNRAVDLHGIGSTNDLSENQLLNIWIALETLVPSHIHGGGKVSKICNGIMPILLKNYLRRIVERISSDLIRWNRSTVSRILRKLPESKSKKLYQKVLEIIVLEEHQALREELYRELGNFHLLRFRVFELNELFKKPNNLVARIELHEKKVAWQIRRIYRTRNLIVHSGRSPAYIETLIENAHDYLDQVMNAIIEYTCGYLDAQTLEQVFDMAKLDYDVYITDLKSIKCFNSENVYKII